MKRTRRQLFRDFALYIAICLAFIAPIYGAVVFNWNFRLTEVTMFGIFIAGCVIVTEVAEQPGLWRETRFRRFLLLYCLGHVAAVYLLYHFVPVVQGWHITALILAEIVIVSDVSNGRMRFFRRTPR